MADLYTTADLVSQVKRRGQIPSSQSTWDAPAILDTATEELHGFVMPLILKQRQEYFVTYADQTLTSGTTEYPIPDRASGQIIREVEVVSADGSIDSLEYYDPDQKEMHTGGSFSGRLGYYLRWNTIVLNRGDASGTLRVYFYVRPGSLVETSSAGKITAIDTVTNTVTLDVSTNPFSANDTVDFLKGTGGHEYRQIDATVSSVSGADVVFSSLPSDLAVNDWLCPSEQSPIPQLPRDLQPLLVQATLVTILDAIGDKRVEYHRKKLAQMTEYARDMITPRNHGEAKVLVTGFPQNHRNWGF